MSTIWHLLEEFNSMYRDDQASSLPICIAHNVTLEQFHAECDQNEHESRGGSRWEFKRGEVWIYELPHLAHDSAAGQVIKKLTMEMGQHADDIFSAASPRCDNNNIANNWSYEPDGSMRVRGVRPGPGHADAADLAGNRWPNIIVEVAYTESEPHVRAKAIDWLGTAITDPNNGVQQVIVIKIGKNVRVDGHRPMKVWRYARGAAENPVQTINFGNDEPDNGATEAGLAEMKLLIPVASLYLPNDPPANLPAPLVLDFFLHSAGH
jgi:hypothetical protein